MGHAINYLTCNKRSEIMAGCKEFAFYNTDRGEHPDGSYHGYMTILDNEPIKKSYEDACEYLKEVSKNRSVQDYAVRYYDINALKDSAKAVALTARLHKNRNEKMEYAKKHAVKHHKAAQVGCKNCNSKISTKFLHSDICPVCGKDLRATYITDRLKKYDDDYQTLYRQLREEREKKAKKAPVKWCYKVEVHC